MRIKQYASAVAAILVSAAIFTACSTEDTLDTPRQTAQTEQVPIGFGNYLSRATQTRGVPTLEPVDVARNGGIGVFAMYTNGRQYNPDSTQVTDTTKFYANFMQHSNLTNTLSSDSLGKATVAAVADNWTYAPIRYWPNGENEYVSFLAYAPYDNDKSNPYRGVLMSNTGYYGGPYDNTYKLHYIAADPRDQIDLLYADPTNITNMQLRRNPTTNEWIKKGDFYESADGHTPLVKLNFKHATSRIGFAITSSTLKDPKNYVYNGGGRTYTFGEVGSSMWIDVIESGSPDVYIRVNKVMFLGDNTSAESTSPTGAFYPYGLLNLANTTESKPLWINGGNSSIYKAFTYDNTETVRTVDGTYRGEDNFSYKDLKGDKKSGGYIWEPSVVDTATLAADEEIGYVRLNWVMVIPVYAGWSETEKVFRQHLTDENNKVMVAKNLHLIDYNTGTADDLTDEVIDNYINGDLHDTWEKQKANYVSNYYKDNELYGTIPTKDDGTVDYENIEVNYIGNNSDDYMFVVPQDFTGDDNPLWMYIDYTVIYLDGNVSGEVKNGINYKVYGKVNKKFEPGKAYIIVADIGAGGSLNAINFTVETENWADEVPVGVNF